MCPALVHILQFKFIFYSLHYISETIFSSGSMTSWKLNMIKEKEKWKRKWSRPLLFKVERKVGWEEMRTMRNGKNSFLFPFVSLVSFCICEGKNFGFKSFVLKWGTCQSLILVFLCWLEVARKEVSLLPLSSFFFFFHFYYSFSNFYVLINLSIRFFSSVNDLNDFN